MKKLYAILGLVLFLSACQKSEDELISNVVFKKDNPQVVVSDDGRSANVTVLPIGAVLVVGLESNVDLSTKSADAWCTAEVKSGNLSLAIDPYEVDSDRSTQVELMYQGAVMATIKVVQSGVATLEIDTADQVQISSAGGNVAVKVMTNQPVWDVTATETWLTIEKSGDGFTLTASKNVKDGERKATVTVKAGEGVNVAERAFTVVQNDEAFVMEITLPQTAISMTLPVTYEVDCTIDWGDGSPVEPVKKNVNPLAGRPAPYHLYTQAGVYQISVTGSVEQLDATTFTLTAAQQGYITRILRWGNLSLKSMNSAFQGCKKLVSIADNTDNSFAEVTKFSGAFNFCEALESIPQGLFRGCDKVTDITSCFRQCLALTEVPEKLFEPLSHLTEAVGVFGFCKKLKSVPAGLLAPLKKVTTFENLFIACESLESVPAGFFDHNTEVVNFSACFMTTKVLRAVPDRLFSKNTKVQNFSTLFNYSGLESIPEHLFEGCTEVVTFKSVFGNCLNIKAIPEGIFRTNTKVTDFSAALQKTSITTVPETLFSSCPEVTNFDNLFWDSPLLQWVPAKLFSKNTKVKSFYTAFGGCKVLETLPEGLLDACPEVTNLSRLCSDAPELKSIPVGLFDNNRKVTNFTSIFRNCKKLTGESPYTMVNGVKVHLYERVNYPEVFSKPIDYGGAFTNCTLLSDWSVIATTRWK